MKVNNLLYSSVCVGRDIPREKAVKDEFYEKYYWQVFWV